MQVAIKQMWTRACAGDTNTFIEILNRLEPMKKILEISNSTDFGAAIAAAYANRTNAKQ
jgi:hypothetical protein